MGINALVTRLDNGGWDFGWSGGTPPYSIWNLGILIATVTPTSYIFNSPGYELTPPDLEILSSGSQSQQEEYPPYVILQWRGLQNAYAYLVEWLPPPSGSEYQILSTILEKGRGYYQWTSLAYPDDTEEQFRVSACDQYGNPGTPIQFSIQICRNPPAPVVDVTISSSGNVVVSP